MGSRTIKYAINIFAILLAVFLLVLLIFSAHRGFDFGDEGFYLISFKNSDIYRGGVSNFYIIISKLTTWLNPDVLEYRFINLFSNILASFVLSYGFWKWIKFNYKNTPFISSFIFVFSFISIGSLLYFTCGIQAISYNSLTNIILEIDAGLILYLFSFPPPNLVKNFKFVIILLIISILCVFSFFVKFSTAVVQFCIYLPIILLYFREQKKLSILLAAFTLIIGCVLGFLIYFIVFESYAEWIYNFNKEYHMIAAHSPKELLGSYISDIIYLMNFLRHNFLFILILPIYSLLRKYVLDKKYHKYADVGSKIILFTTAVYFVYKVYRLKMFRSAYISLFFGRPGHLYVIIILILVFAILWNIVSKKIITFELLKRNLNKISILVLLLITPMLGVFGSANPLFFNSMFYTAPWFCAILILLYSLFKLTKDKVAIYACVIFISICATSQIVDGNLFLPYYSVYSKNKATFFQQTEPVKELPQLDGVYVDKNTKAFLVDIHNVLDSNGYKKRYPVMGIWMAGLVYLVDGVSPGYPFYGGLDVADSVNCMYFKSFKMQNNPPIVFVTDDKPLSVNLVNTMKSRGVNYPDDYLLKGDIYYPYTNSKMKIYFPKSYIGTIVK